MFQVFIPKKPASLTRRSQPNRLCADRSRSNKRFGLLLDSRNQMVGGVVLTLGGKDQLVRFEQAILPHLDAAYNLARWLTRNDHDAEDVVQEAYLRALKFFASFRGGDGRAWLLTTVRHTCYTWLQKNRGHQPMLVFDEAIHGRDGDDSNPEKLLLQSEDIQLLRQALDDLPVEFREVIVLRDLEDLSYKEISEIAGIPAGTVMSRLARARGRLQQALSKRMHKEP